MRTSHSRVRCQRRGTLYPDGSFVAEEPGRPVTDGGGAFGVGIPMPRQRR